jgi:putative flippase GtrA
MLKGEYILKSAIALYKKMWDKKIVRFLVVGSFNFIVDAGILNLLTIIFGLRNWIANTVSVTIAITISYLLNHRIVFRHPQKYSIKSYAKFFLVTGFSSIVIQNFIIDYVAPKVAPIHASQVVHILNHAVSAQVLRLNIAKVLAVIVGMIWNFLLYKYIIFRNQEQPDEAEEVLIV